MSIHTPIRKTVPHNGTTILFELTPSSSEERETSPNLLYIATACESLSDRRILLDTAYIRTGQETSANVLVEAFEERVKELVDRMQLAKKNFTQFEGYK
jgi:hypothetical protein